MAEKNNNCRFLALKFIFSRVFSVSKNYWNVGNHNFSAKKKKKSYKLLARKLKLLLTWSHFRGTIFLLKRSSFPHNFLFNFVLVNSVISTQKVDANNDARGAAPPKKAQLLFEGQETNKSLKVGTWTLARNLVMLITFFPYVMPLNQACFLAQIEFWR